MRSYLIVAVLLVAIGVASVVTAGNRIDHAAPVADRTIPPVAPVVGGSPRHVISVSGATPVLAVVGASIAAGTGASAPNHAWPALLAQEIGWQAVVSADPGAGYLALGSHDLGPMRRLMSGLNLSTLHPAMVLVEAGSNDIRWPASVVSLEVRDVIREIRTEAPDAVLGLVTVFPRGSHPGANSWTVDRAIIAAAQDIDPTVYVFDPLASNWTFTKLPDQLHPNPLGHQWIADRLASDFRRLGLVTTDTAVRPEEQVLDRIPAPR